MCPRAGRPLQDNWITGGNTPQIDLIEAEGLLLALILTGGALVLKGGAKQDHPTSERSVIPFLLNCRRVWIQLCVAQRRLR